jgi:hypothetical protein
MRGSVRDNSGSAPARHVSAAIVIKKDVNGRILVTALPYVVIILY